MDEDNPQDDKVDPTDRMYRSIGTMNKAINSGVLVLGTGGGLSSSHAKDSIGSLSIPALLGGHIDNRCNKAEQHNP